MNMYRIICSGFSWNRGIFFLVDDIVLCFGFRVKIMFITNGCSPVAFTKSRILQLVILSCLRGGWMPTRDGERKARGQQTQTCKGEKSYAIWCHTK